MGTLIGMNTIKSIGLVVSTQLIKPLILYRYLKNSIFFDEINSRLEPINGRLEGERVFKNINQGTHVLVAFKPARTWYESILSKEDLCKHPWENLSSIKIAPGIAIGWVMSKNFKYADIVKKRILELDQIGLLLDQGTIMNNKWRFNEKDGIQVPSSGKTRKCKKPPKGTIVDITHLLACI